MLYRPYISGLFAALAIPIHRYRIVSTDTTITSAHSTKASTSHLSQDRFKTATQASTIATKESNATTKVSNVAKLTSTAEHACVAEHTSIVELSFAAADTAKRKALAEDTGEDRAKTLAEDTGEDRTAAIAEHTAAAAAGTSLAEASVAATSTSASTPLAATAVAAIPVELLEQYSPYGMSYNYHELAEHFAQHHHLAIGDRLHVVSPTALGAVRLPDQSLVVIGPISYQQNLSFFPTKQPAKSAPNNTANKSQPVVTTTIKHKPQKLVPNRRKRTAPNTYSKSARSAWERQERETPELETQEWERQDREHGMDNSAMLHMKLRMANLWLDMISQIVVHQEIPASDEHQLYAEADKLIPLPLKGVTKEIKLNAPHNQYRYELAILDAVSEGDIDKVTRAFSIPLQGKFGVLASDPLRSMQNHVHNLNSLVSRAAIKAGILPEQAYALSDKFFLAAEQCKTIEQCLDLRTMCAQAFATMVRQYREQNQNPRPPLVTNAILQVSRALFTTCTVNELAARLNVTPTHLERVFKQSMHIKLSDYITQEKIKQAQELLRDTTESIADIATMLHFASASHFSACFKLKTGLTPRQYRSYAASLNQG